MKIDDKNIGYEITRHYSNTVAGNDQPAADKRLNNEEKSAGENDRVKSDTVVSLSQASKEAQIIREAASTEPAVREEKVSELKEKIESGDYKVDSDAVADKLVDAFLDDIFHI